MLAFRGAEREDHSSLVTIFSDRCRQRRTVLVDSRQCPEPFHGKKFNAAEIEDELGTSRGCLLCCRCWMHRYHLGRDDRRDRMPLLRI